jgi:hypothetical protein
MPGVSKTAARAVAETPRRAMRAGRPAGPALWVLPPRRGEHGEFHGVKGPLTRRPFGIWALPPGGCRGRQIGSLLQQASQTRMSSSVGCG